MGRCLLNRQLVTALLLILLGGLTALTPYIVHINVYYAVGFASGIGCGNWNTVSATWLLEMWSGRRLASLLQALNLCYGLGSILGPLIVRPYLRGYLGVGEQLLSEKLIADRRATLFVPFAVCGAAEAAVGLLLLVSLCSPIRYYYHHPRSLAKAAAAAEQCGSNALNLKRLESPANRRRHLHIAFFALIMLLVGASNLAEIGHLSFEPVFLQSPQGANMSSSSAAEIASVTATAFTAGRGLSVLTASYLSPGALIAIHLLTGMASVTGLIFTQSSGFIVVALNSAAIGLALSAMTPAILAYAHSLVEVDDRRNALFFTALLLPSIFGPLVIGPHLERFPSILLLLDLAALAAALAVFLCSVLLVKRCASK